MVSYLPGLSQFPTVMRFYLAIFLAIMAGSVQASPREAVSYALGDAKTINPAEAFVSRYLACDHIPSPLRKEAIIGTFGLIQALSLEPTIKNPDVILADGSVVQWPRINDGDYKVAVSLRINLTDYGWDPKVWDRLEIQDHHLHAKALKFFPTGVDAAGHKYAAGDYPIIIPHPSLNLQEFNALQAYCGGAKTPVLFLDNFVWQVAIQSERKVGYYGLQGIKDRDTYFKKIGLDIKLATGGFTREYIAAVAESGIAQEPRRIIMYEKIGGEAWATLDNFANDAGDFANPLRILNGGFTHRAEEWFGHGANGFWKVLLVDAAGKLQDSAPDRIGGDRTSRSNNLRIEVGLSCWRCHINGGMQPINDWVRALFVDSPLPLTGPDAALVAKLKQQYLRPIDPRLQDGRDRHERAVKAATGLDHGGWIKYLDSVFHRYDSPVDLDRAGRELGVRPEDIVEALERYTKAQPTQTSDTILAVWRLPKARQKAIPLSSWVEESVVAEAATRGFTLPLRVPK